MEVSSTHLPRTLIGGGVRTRAFVAFGIVFVAMLIVVGSQPIRSPWWTYADADASYTATGIDLFAGEHSFFLDHPGMPIQDLMAMTRRLTRTRVS